MSTATADPVAEAMPAMLAAGLSIIPIDWTTKRPAMDLLPRYPNTSKPTWAPFQEARARTHEVNGWVNAGVKAFAVVCGRISGGDDDHELLILDFDEPGFYDAWLEAVGDLADGLVVQETGGGGQQVALRCTHAGQNEKLAYFPDDDTQDGRRVAIETRGNGGYAVLPPSLHPTGNRYQTSRTFPS
jgi:hypothetical protein